jgi:hypothetical protein
MPGAQVTAVPWGQRFAVFIVDPNGGIYCTGGTPDGPYGPWALIPGLQTVRYGFVTAAPWEGRFALFVADENGVIHSIVGDPQQGFEQPWESVSDGQTVPGAQIAAVVPSVGAPVTLFVADRAGGVYTVEGRPKQAWGSWSPVAPGNFYTEPGSYITAEWQAQTGSFELHLIDISGGIYHIVGDPKKGWRPYGFGNPIGVAGHGNPVNSIGSELFVTDAVGDIYWNPAVQGSGFEKVPDGSAAPGSPVTACRVNRSAITLFVVNRDGVVVETSTT